MCLSLPANSVAPHPRVLRFLEGGKLGDNECGARSHHGYQGIEERVIDDIAAWILNPKAL